MIEEHKANKVEEPLVVDKGTVRRVLEHSGVSEEHVEAFEERYDDAFGADADLSPRNLVDTKQLEITTPDVTIKVSPDRGDLVETPADRWCPVHSHPRRRRRCRQRRPHPDFLN